MSSHFHYHIRFPNPVKLSPVVRGDSPCDPSTRSRQTVGVRHVAELIPKAQHKNGQMQFSVLSLKKTGRGQTKCNKKQAGRQEYVFKAAVQNRQIR